MGMTNSTDSGRTTAIISYITLVGCLIAITMNMEPKDAFARFHIRQAFGIHLLFHVLAIGFSYSGILVLSLVAYGLYLLLWGYGFLQALGGKSRPLPLLGDYFQKWFTFVP